MDVFENIKLNQLILNKFFYRSVPRRKRVHGRGGGERVGRGGRRHRRLVGRPQVFATAVRPAGART